MKRQAIRKCGYCGDALPRGTRKTFCDSVCANHARANKPKQLDPDEQFAAAIRGKRYDDPYPPEVRT